MLKQVRNGIVELKYLDPRKVKKIREVRKRRPEGMISPTKLILQTKLLSILCITKEVSGGASCTRN